MYQIPHRVLGSPLSTVSVTTAGTISPCSRPGLGLHPCPSLEGSWPAQGPLLFTGMDRHSCLAMCASSTGQRAVLCLIEKTGSLNQECAHPWVKMAAIHEGRKVTMGMEDGPETKSPWKRLGLPAQLFIFFLFFSRSLVRVSLDCPRWPQTDNRAQAC